MTILFDASSSALAFVSGGYSVNHTPVGTPAAVCISIIHAGSAAGVSGVTYGGVSVPLISISPYASSVSGEPATIHTYFLGSGVPAGTQSASISATGAVGRYTHVMTLTAGADVEVNQATKLLDSGGQTNPSVSLALNSKTSFVYQVHMSGSSSTGNTSPLANWSDRGEGDLGSQVSGVYTYNIEDSVNVDCGFTNGQNEDVLLAGIALNEIVVAGLSIATIDDGTVNTGDSGVVITGVNFEATTGTLTISPTDNESDTNAIVLTTSAWTDTSITVDFPSNLSMLYGTVYMFVTTDSAVSMVNGKTFQNIPVAGNQYLTIKEQNDLGVLKDVTGIELDSDQLEWTTLSQGGGTVYMGVSGTVFINDYAGAVPSTDEIYIRLGDASDSTWSSSTLDTISIGANAIPVSLNNAESTSLGVSNALEITSSSELSVNESVASGISLPADITTRTLLNDLSSSSTSLAVSLALSTTIVLSSFDAISSGVHSSQVVSLDVVLSNSNSASLGVNSSNIITTKTGLATAESASVGISNALNISSDSSLSNVDAVSSGIYSSQVVSLDAVLDNSNSTSLGVNSSNIITTKTSLATAETMSVGTGNALDLSSDSSLLSVDAVSSGNYSSANLKVVSKLSDQGSTSSGTSFVSDISIGGSLSDASSISLGINVQQLISTRAVLQNSEQVSSGVFDSQAVANNLSLLNANSISLGISSANNLTTHALLQASSRVSAGLSSSLALGGSLALNAVEAISLGLTSSTNLSTSALLGDSKSYSSGIFYEGIITTNSQLEIFSSIGQSVNSASTLTTKTSLSDVQSLAFGNYLVGELVYLSPNSFLSSASKSKELSSISKTIYFT